jgi:hypothetical protein
MKNARIAWQTKVSILQPAAVQGASLCHEHGALPAHPWISNSLGEKEHSKGMFDLGCLELANS